MEDVGGGAGEILNLHVPAAGEVGGGGVGRFGRFGRRRSEGGDDTVGDDFLIAGGHHVGHHLNAVGAGSGGEGDAGFGGKQVLGEGAAGDVGFGGIPLNDEGGGVVGEAFGKADFGRDAGDGGDAFGDMVEAPSPLGPFGFVVAFEPHFDGHQHADGFFLADFHGASEAVVGRAVDPGGANKILFAEEYPGGLGAAHALAAAVGDEGGTGLEVNVGDGEAFGGGVDKDGDIALAGEFADYFRGQRAGFGVGAGEDVDHGGFRSEGGFEFFDGAGFDDGGTDGADGGVVNVSGVIGDDDFGFGEAFEVGDADVEIGVAAGDTGRGGVGDGGGAATGDHAPFGLREFGETGPDAGHEFINVNVVLGGFGHGPADFGEHRGAANDCERAAGVDEGFDADGLIDGGAELEAGGGGGGCLRGKQAGEEAEGGSAKHVAAEHGLAKGGEGFVFACKAEEVFREKSLHGSTLRASAENSSGGGGCGRG